MVIWVVSREYAGLAEAGGVKNVACSLSENLVRLGNKVMLFIPFYGCTDVSRVSDYTAGVIPPVEVNVMDSKETVSFSSGVLDGVEIIFVCHHSFAEKLGVYTYTERDEKENPAHKRGSGHEDALFLNTLFQKAVVAFGNVCSHEQIPDIIHCQDATTAMVPVFVMERSNEDMAGRIVFARSKCVVTIHNAGPGYHHDFSSVEEAHHYTNLPKNLLEKGLNGTHVEPFLLSALNARITTVSPQYAQEILSGSTETAGLSECFKARHIEIEGITNGIEFDKYDPTDVKKSFLPYTFNPAKKDLIGKYKCRALFLEKYARIPNDTDNRNKDLGIDQCGHIETGNAGDPCEPVFITYHGRIVRQKGIDVLAEAADKLLSMNEPVRFIFIGQGEPELENQLALLSLKYGGKCIFLRGYDRAITRLCTAVADFIALPSKFEPCGLEDFIAQLFGTLPIAHATGGLCKIVDEQTGFLFKPDTSDELASMIKSLVQLKQADSDIFNNMIAYAASYVRENYSWRTVVKERYLVLYRKLLNKKK